MKRLYVLTRNDLGIAYQSVQGSHAVAQFMLDYPNHEWKNGYLIFLEVDDGESLMQWVKKLRQKQIMLPDDKKFEMSIFRESDLDNEITSVAVYTNGRIFANLDIMHEKNKEDNLK